MAHGANEDGSLNIPVIQRPRRRTWFLDGDIVRMVHVSRAQGIVTLWNCTKELKFSMTMAEFKKKEKGPTPLQRQQNSSTIIERVSQD
jgi:hypothetical protein